MDDKKSVLNLLEEMVREFTVGMMLQLGKVDCIGSGH